MAFKNLLTQTAHKLLACRSISISARREQNLWSPDNIVKSPHRSVDIPNRTLPEHMWENLEKWADKTALVCGITNRSYTYHQMYKYSKNFASKLRTQMKLRDNDVVFVMMPNVPEFALVTFGALEAGATVSTCNPIYTAHEIQRQIMLSDPKIVIGVPETVQILKEALALLKKDIPIIVIKGPNGSLPTNTIAFEEFALADNVDHSVLKEVKRHFEDVAFLPYSSGTTGLPKGVEILHRNIVVQCLQQNVETLRQYDETTKTNQDTALGILPFFHIYCLSIVLLHKLSVGMKIVTVPKFHPSTFVNVLKEHPINLICAAPPLVLFLGAHPEVTKHHLASVKTITSGAAPLPRNDVLRVLEKVKPSTDFLNMYGLTETSPLALTMIPGSDNYSSVGYGLPNTELRIIDSKLQPLGPNEVGELLIRGPQVMRGYKSNPEATREAITKDGWFRTGDLATIDKDGVVTIADRLKELIKVKGYQVPPAELENVLKEHPDILDAAVLGIPDKRLGEAPKAFVVLKEGHKEDAEGIMEFVAERVAEYKRIKHVMFLDAIPKNPAGKMLRRVLKEKYC